MVVNGRGRAWIGVVLLFAGTSSVACGADPTSSATLPDPAVGGTGTGGTSGTGGGESTECICSDGRVGMCRCSTSSCDYCAGSCDCSSCPTFDAMPNPPFTACGGEPFGTWRTKEFPSISRTWTGIGDFNVMYGPCLIGLSQVSSEFDFRVSLTDAGVLEMSNTEVSYNASVLLTCYDRRDHGCDFMANQVVGGDCIEGACGICECTNRYIADTSSGTWTRSENTLTLDGTPYEYCVEGDTLFLRATYSDYRFQLTRVERFGRPSPCETRTPETCLVGGGCMAGRCVGTGTCAEGSSEADCTNRMGCSWDRTPCTGEVPSGCTFSDYDRVPGCRFVGPGAACIGTPLPCEPKGEQDCRMTPGCILSTTTPSTCSGTPRVCAGLTLAECGLVPGCDAQ